LENADANKRTVGSDDPRAESTIHVSSPLLETKES
jgi:hypothetical protein